MNDVMNWESVVADLAPALYRYFRASFATEIAEDLVQITLTRLIEKTRAGQFDSSKGSLRMYTYGIAHFVRLEAMRAPSQAVLNAASRELSSSPVDMQLDLEEKAEIQSLRSAISELSAIQQNILHLYLDREITLKEIGGILNLPEGSVKSHIHRAKNELKSILNPKASSSEKISKGSSQFADSTSNSNSKGRSSK